MSEIKERMNEIIDEFKGRAKNPLILSFILVWLYKHWSLVYKVLTFNNTLDVNERIKQIQCYIKCHGWQGMVFCPIIFAFLSLITFYIIGAIAQYLKLYLGVRLPAWMMAKNDTGNYVLRSKYNSEKRKSDIIKSELESATSEAYNLRNYKDKLEKESQDILKENTKLNKDIGELKKNILSNNEIKQNLELSISFYLLKYLQINNKKHLVFPQDLVSDDYRISNGNWDVEYAKSFVSTVSRSEIQIFKDNQITRSNASSVGEIYNHLYDKKHGILTYKLKVKNTPDLIPFELIRVTNNEFIGFNNDSFIRMKRRDN